MPRKQYFHNIKRVVIKIGSSSLTGDAGISHEKMSAFVKQTAALVRGGYQVVLVTSGAVSAGAGKLSRDRSSLSIPEKQALAAVGQTILMNEYRTHFIEEGLEVGQILMTEDDVKNRNRYLNVRNTMNELLHMNVIPIVNENDSVVVKEIKVGDNDTLSAYVTNLVEAQLLILLSDIDGFYYDLKDEFPADVIYDIDETIINAAGGSGSLHGTGGMMTKIRAADMIIRSGGMMVIAKSAESDVLERIVKGHKIGTLFLSKNRSLSGRKRWISFHLSVAGAVKVDDGAHRALVEGNKSLLASGIVEVSGEFSQGDGVELCRKDGTPFGKGITNYANDELEKIKGKKSSEIEEILGSKYYDEAIHRDNLTIY